jgi:hypothetical protein
MPIGINRRGDLVGMFFSELQSQLHYGPGADVGQCSRRLSIL